MVFVLDWVRTKKTPVPRNEIMKHLFDKGIGRGTAEASVHSLIVKSYIRKAYAISNKTSYVQLRGI